MSLQYMADLESEVTAGDNDIDEIFTAQWIEPGLVLAGTMDGRLRAWHAKDGSPIGSAARSAHRIGVTAISSSAANQTVLTSAMDGTVVWWDTSDVAEHVANMPSSEAHNATTAQQEEQGSSWPLIMLGKFTLGAGAKGQGDASAGADSLVVKGSKVAITTRLHPTEPLFAATGLDASLLLYTLDDNDGIGTCQLQAQLWPNEGADSGQGVADEARGKQRDCGLSLAFSASGDVVAVGTQKGRVHLYEVGKKQWLDSIAAIKSAVRAMCFLPGGELLVGLDNGDVHVYDVRAAAVSEDSHMFVNEDLGGYRDLFDDDDDDAEDFSSSQQSPYTVGQGSSTQESFSSMFSQTQERRGEPRRNAAPLIRTWNTGSPWITDVRTSPDGRIIATGSRDGTVRIWDFKAPPPPTALCTISHDGEICALSWKPLPEGTTGKTTTNGSMTAATQSASTASAFVTGSSDGRVRWYRCAGGAASVL